MMLCLSFLLSGCAGAGETDSYITVSLTLPEGCSAKVNGLTIRSGEDAVFELTIAEGYAFSGVDYGGEYTVETRSGKTYLRLCKVLYPTSAQVELTSFYCAISYFPNGGTEAETTLYYNKAIHLRPNTATGLFSREGFTQTGWNTAPDGSGIAVGLGSRVSVPEGSLRLYAQWAQWSPVEDFSWEDTTDGIRITGYHGEADCVVVPGALEGKPVTTIGAKAFSGCKAVRVILPQTLVILEEGAFENCALRELTFFDNLEAFSDGCFLSCPDFSTVHINAIEAPYGYRYRQESCFADKIDILIEAKGRKLVCYGGCSMWYNLDGDMAQSTVGEGYQVINLGLNGVINSAAQMQILTHFLEEGDVFFHTPEISSESQLMRRTEMISHDRKLWSGLEYNYDLAALLDIRTLPNFFDIFHYWLEKKEPISNYGEYYKDSLGNIYVDKYGCASFDKTTTATELADDVFLDPAFYTDSGMAALERYYEAIEDRGVKIYVSFACVNMDAVPEAQQDNVALMDACFRDSIGSLTHVTVIGRLSDHLYHTYDFYDTNYHLLTQSAKRNTQVWMADLTAQMRLDGLL